MNHLPTLITDLALILGSAGIVTLIFKKLKQPVVLGYIIAGLLVGPNMTLYPTIGDIEGVKSWGEIGVVFLLFALGLEFSFKKIAKGGGSSAIAGIFEVACMTILGYATGRFLGWSQIDCMFLGGIIAISSTTIVFRAFDELGLKTRRFAGVVMGILIIEDLAAVLLLVLLTTLSVSRDFEGSQLLFSIGKLFFFLCLWFLAGIFLLPSFLKRVRNLMSDETLLVVSCGLCLLMVVVASSVGFSAALGAFIMGSILAETTEAEHIDKLVKSVKNLFGAVFFVSVGMLIDPKLLIEYAGPVLLITAVVIIGKTVNVTVGALLSGQPLKQSVQSGVSLSQIGEFSFIIATLGLDLKVTSSYLYPIAVGVSVITTFTTPYMMKLANPLYNWLVKVLPNRWLRAIDRYSAGTQTIQAESDWKKVLRAYGGIIIINGVMIVAVVLLTSYYVAPFISREINNARLATAISIFIAFGIMSPFLWALMVKQVRSEHSRFLWLDNKYNRGPLLMLEASRNVIAVLLVGFLFRQFFSFWLSIGIAAVIMAIVLLIFSKKLQSFYQRIEKRFITNLNDRETIEYVDGKEDLSPWDAHLAYFDVSPNLDFIGKRLIDLGWREKYGINIASIERGNNFIRTPTREEVIYPYDKIAVIGTDQQMQNFRPVIEAQKSEPPTQEDEMVLDKIIVDSHNHLTGKTIRNSGLREKTNGLVVGIERNGERILNPHSDTEFAWDDIVWIVGDKKKIEEF
ncbi:cation:proton antiporter [Pinibacter aurantiacus]|uniref:Cation:proton antiporter n=1 Tax=Pinibacter aurantiacus TaxID=2851599 RepID=A0A9E2W678_9BACT|nr:cation:proton antiporter [Pinibacter aurantiacus]MBV4359523.1 cation:proton antiporter [Pinibacter aurantiacus]